MREYLVYLLLAISVKRTVQIMKGDIIVQFMSGCLIKKVSELIYITEIIKNSPGLYILYGLFGMTSQ